MKHSKLVAISAKWLSKRNPVVVTEFGLMNGENPDALGFDNDGMTTMVEAKVSRADFLADASKESRENEWSGVGNYRYYIAPKGMLTEADIPDGWGLLEVVGSSAQVTIHPKHYGNADYRTERLILMSLVRRLSDGKERGVNIKVMKAKEVGKERATLVVEGEDGL